VILRPSPGTWLVPTEMECRVTLTAFRDYWKALTTEHAAMLLAPAEVQLCPSTVHDDYDHLVRRALGHDNLRALQGRVAVPAVIGVDLRASLDGVLRYEVAQHQVADAMDTLFQLLNTGPMTPDAVFEAARAVLEPLGARVQLSQIVLGRAPSADPVADFATEFVADDQVEALVALVREGDRTTFREQAQLLGVPTDKLDELWTGTRARLRLGDKSAPVAP